MSLKEEFEKHGWIILRDFFSKDEITQIRQATEKSLDILQADLLCNPYLADLTILNTKIISLVREILNGDPVYIGDSNISYRDTGMSLHKDNPDRFDGNAPDWRSHYDILRMGIYLQDYTTDSGGLILRDGSHMYPTRWKGTIINVQCKPGDLIVWNLRTTHSGNAKRLKINPQLTLNPYLCKLLPDFLFRTAPSNRMALFISYGLSGTHMDRYIKYLKSRKYALQRWHQMNITPELLEKGNKNGLRILDLIGDAKQLNIQQANENHVELAY